jgi:hypothetical protein
MKDRTGETVVDSHGTYPIEPDAYVEAFVGSLGAIWDAGVIHEFAHAERFGVAPLGPRHMDDMIAAVAPTEAARPTRDMGTTVNHLRLENDPAHQPGTCRSLGRRHGGERVEAGGKDADNCGCSDTAQLHASRIKRH